MVDVAALPTVAEEAISKNHRVRCLLATCRSMRRKTPYQESSKDAKMFELQRTAKLEGLEGELLLDWMFKFLGEGIGPKWPCPLTFFGNYANCPF